MPRTALVPLALVLATAVAVAVTTGACTAPGGASQRVETLLGGPDAVRMIATPGTGTTVEAYRIDGMALMEGRADGATETVHGYPVVAGPVAVDGASATALADVLTSDDTYLWDVAKACEFLPGVALRWREAATTVDVLLCFSCDEVEVYVAGRRVGHEDFDPRRPDLVRVAQRLFPEDDAIRALR